KYLNQYQPAYPEPPGWDEWDAAGNGYGEFDYNLNQNGQQQHYGNAPQDYLTDVLAAKARSFIDSSAASGRPFMLEVATFAPHAPYTPAPRSSWPSRRPRPTTGCPLTRRRGLRATRRYQPPSRPTSPARFASGWRTIS